MLLMVATAYTLYDMLAPLRARMSKNSEQEIEFSPIDPLAPQSQEGKEFPNPVVPVTYLHYYGNGCCSQYVHFLPNDSVNPQSSEQSTGHSITTQNVTFHDYSPGAMVSVPSEMDSVRAETISNDLDLNNFFSRPVLIRFFEVQVGTNATTLVAGFNPWSLYFRNPRVANRISNFKMMRAKLHIRVLINGSPMHYARYLMVYTPLHTNDDVGAQSATFNNIINQSQKPHLYLNPTTSQGGDMELPFLWSGNALDLPLGEFDDMGQLDFYGLTPTRHANGGTSDVQISVYAWATDVVLSCPTTCNVDGISPQSDEYTNRTFSVRATALANTASSLSHAPIIGPYARATSIAASAASAIAALFGFSKPVETERTLIVPKTVANMATTDNKDDSNKLSLDTKQELTVDPRAFGLSGKDEMDILSIAQRESFVTTFTWTSGNSSPAGTILWNTIVDPCVYAISTATTPDLPRINMTASCFAAAPFQYWRGSIKYRFQIVCSAMHKGRLRIVYDPEIECTYNDPTRVSPEYNLGFNTVIDIAETKDFEITVGWGQPTTYREQALANSGIAMWSNTPLPYDASTNNFGNGVLGVYVVNEVVCPSASVDDIYVIVSMCAGPDFEVAAPTSKTIQQLRYRSFEDVPTPQSRELLPQSAEVSSPIATVAGGETNTEEAPEQADTLAQVGDLHGHANMVHFGESIRSFRSLLKRYSEVETIFPFTGNGVGVGVLLQRSSFPTEPGYTAKSSIASTVTDMVGGKPYLYGYLTPLRYVSSGFVGWRGGVRWKVAIPPHCCSSWLTLPTVSRYTGCEPENLEQVFGTAVSNATRSARQIFFDQAQPGADGLILVAPSVEPVASFEVPFYSKYRFNHARSLTSFVPDADTARNCCWKFAGTVNSAVANMSFTTYVAAAEDFNLGMFIGAPIVYLEAIPPS
jgi:hypothetical protein